MNPQWFPWYEEDLGGSQTWCLTIWFIVVLFELSQLFQILSVISSFWNIIWNIWPSGLSLSSLDLWGFNNDVLDMPESPQTRLYIFKHYEWEGNTRCLRRSSKERPHIPNSAKWGRNIPKYSRWGQNARRWSWKEMSVQNSLHTGKRSNWCNNLIHPPAKKASKCKE